MFSLYDLKVCVVPKYFYENTSGSHIVPLTQIKTCNLRNLDLLKFI